MKLGLFAALLAASTSFATTVYAQQATVSNNDGTITLRGGVGVLAIESREYVFAGTGSRDYLSLLIWQSAAPMLNASLDVQLPNSWSLQINADAAMAGDSYMEDYDWIPPFVAGTPDMSNWTDQSKHPNTNLDWYFNGSVLAAYSIPLESGATVRLNGGLEYTDVRWTAYDGTFIYSSGGFRNDVGTFAAGRGITYRQQLPAIVTGANVQFEHGGWDFDIGAKAGITFAAQATDDHWQRDLRFVEDVYMAPLLGASASATYGLSDKLNLTLSGKVDRVFLGRSDTAMFDIPTGAAGGTSINASGAELLSGALKVGLAGSF